MGSATKASFTDERDEFDKVFQETGIAVLQFAKGDELKMLQDEVVDRATRFPKITIHNETEVIESETTTAELGEVTHPWTTVALDCARMQRRVNAWHCVH